MKKVHILFIVIILAASCGRKTQPQGAKIEFENTEFNVGKIKQGEIVGCYFVVRNTGDSMLVFNQIIPNCDCTSLTNKNAEIPAGKTDTLKFLLDTYGKDLGKFESDIRIITNTIPDWHKLNITAEIE
ncbi:MAG: DUF1573 domain-containing protein [Prevotellaceae bacterium]|jgi:hypothetical protein|nr:DUF1573 domain-containing protein [Prevotellaceae bacterium]